MLRLPRRPPKLLLLSSLTAFLAINADSLPDPTTPHQQPLKALLRTYLVYSLCSVPAIVDASPKILQTLTNIPILRNITYAVVKVTFFDQFVGGESATSALPLLRSLRLANKGALLAYSVEADEINPTANPPHKQIVAEILSSINVAADFEDSLAPPAPSRPTWVAIKLTALLPDPHALVSWSQWITHQRREDIPFPGTPLPTDMLAVQAPNLLTQQDIHDLQALHADLVRICTRAKQRRVKIIIDAEYSRYQPALDALTQSLMQQFNTTQPLIYATHQTYLRRAKPHLLLSLAHAKQHGYALGVKLVRGAYWESEVEAKEGEIPVWATKPQTDATFDECAKILIRAVRDDVFSISPWAGVSWKFWKQRPPQTTVADSGTNASLDQPRIAVLFGTHNWSSCRSILHEIVRCGLGEVVTFPPPFSSGGTIGSGNNVTTGLTTTPTLESTLSILDPNSTHATTNTSKIKLHPALTPRVSIAQLYGMCDDLTDALVSVTIPPSSHAWQPWVIKYIPYGGLEEVLPYLSRRAVENKSVLGDGAAERERKRAAGLIWGLVWGGTWR